jgi:FMN phosphatase YigB (HAD superfamily)
VSGQPVDRWSFTPREAADATVSVDDDLVCAVPYSRPEWIFFDIGLTLVHPSADAIAAVLRAHFPDGDWTPRGVIGSLVCAAEARHVPWPSELSGDARVHRAWASLLQLPPCGAEILGGCLERLDLYCEVDPTAKTVLRELAARGVGVGAISNSDGTLDEELAHFGLSPYFDVVIDSGAIGVEKPHGAIFQAALNAAEVDAHDVWHVGDGLINDYLAAAAVGISPLLLDRHGAHSGTPVHRMSRLAQLLIHPTLEGVADPSLQE